MMDLAKVEHDVAEYVRETLDGYSPSAFSSPKVIRDAVYGFQRFDPHELSIIDSPVVQRLRRVHQTALSYLVYPSANHTRFEHSLGVATKAEQMLLALAGSSSISSISSRDRIELRLAGLLHDLGHGLFSHLTETLLIQRHPTLVREIKLNPDFAEKTKLGEALSALVVRAPAFRDLFERIKECYPDLPGLADVDLDRIANLILGKAPSEGDQYLADIISGPFDADKLDYLGRDCHFTGIRAEIDWERINHSLDIYEAENGVKHLAVWESAVPHLEQILFSKMMMFSAVYHHHKIRTLESMVNAVFERALAAEHLSEKVFRLDSVVDIWRLDEAAFFTLGLREPAIASDVRAILDRNLLKRSLILSMGSRAKDPENVEQYRQFQKLSADPQGIDTLAQIAAAVYEDLDEGIRSRIQPHQIRFDFPRSPALSDDAEQCHVLVAPGDARPLSDFFPSEDWVATYADGKLTAHVLAAGDLEVRTAVAISAEKILNILYRIRLNDQARRALK